MTSWNRAIVKKDENSNGLADMKIDATFRKINKNAICFHIWKVEQDRIESLHQSQYGIFSSDSTYIIYAAALKTSSVQQDTITRENKNQSSLERYIHFWLGSDTTPQNSGNVAYKIMELDAYLCQTASQYREVQGNESGRFMSYFRKGIIIMSGINTNLVQPARLYEINGRKWPICTEKKNISWENFSSSSIMLFKTEKYLFAWLGRSTSSSEKQNAIIIAKRIQEIYKISEIIIIDDGYEQSMNEACKYEWNQHLNLKNRSVHQPKIPSQCPKLSIKLYKCGYNSGKYRIEEIKSDALEQMDLSDSNAVYIIDSGFLGVWAWVGKFAKVEEKLEAMRNARGFVKKKNYPNATPVIRVLENHEPVEFIRLFPRPWKVPDLKGKKTPEMIGKMDSVTLLQRPKVASDTQLIDDGTGKRFIYRITDGNYSEIHRQKHNPFFSGECYIIQYQIVFSENDSTNRDFSSDLKHILYFWAGGNVSKDIKAKCETLAIDIFENLDINAMMVKINEGFETPHFLQIFNGKFITLKGNMSDYEPNGFNLKSCPNLILKVYGDSTFNSKAIQVNPLLDMPSKECFVIKSNILWVWCGQYSTGDAREIAKNIGSLFGEYILVMESKEPENFWDSISNKFHQANNNNNYSQNYDVQEIYKIEKIPPELYISYAMEGKLYTQEIVGFQQSDLSPEDIYLLDIGTNIFIWLGTYSSNTEKSICWLMVKNYILKYPVERKIQTAVTLIRQGFEPNIFIGFFENWDEQYWNNFVSFDMTRLNIKTPDSSISSNVSCENEFDKYQKFPISILQQEADLLPQEVDPIQKEIHLTHDDFISVFNMKFEDFNSLPAWKKQELKKKFKLF